MPPAQTKEVIERELNAPLEDVFEWIDLQKPLGSASISQVSICCSPSVVVMLLQSHWLLKPLQGHTAHMTTANLVLAKLFRMHSILSIERQQFAVPTVKSKLFHDLFALNRHCCKHNVCV